MAEFCITKATHCDDQHHQRLLFPDLAPYEPAALSSPSTPKPFRRGPMYSTYTELRDWNLRMKKVNLNSSSPNPLPLTRSSFSCSMDRDMAFRKENRKPTRAVGLGFESCMTPPPLAPKLELKKVGSVSVGRIDEKKKGNGGALSGGLFGMRRSFSGFNQLKEISKLPKSRIEEEGRGSGWSKVVSRKSFTGVERPKTVKATGYMG
ncbi:hypothetical protein KSP39_PZI022285 [Platanthera zijinensis]|uniref:Uncharacterized protein n=1 Tax=Platanthera zijinensis TaxID=2320716 RepID=A0AAP0AVM7_9ASPA